MISIYMITNKVNGKAYIGQAKNVEERWKKHITGSSKCKAINAAIQKYGADSFDFKVIGTCQNKPEANVAERFFIKMLGTFGSGYNLTVGGDGASPGKNHYGYGKPRSEETRKKISIATTGEKHHRAKLTNHERLEIIDLYTNKIYSQPKLAALYDVTQRCISRIIKKHK